MAESLFYQTISKIINRSYILYKMNKYKCTYYNFFVLSAICCKTSRESKENIVLKYNVQIGCLSISIAIPVFPAIYQKM